MFHKIFDYISNNLSILGIGGLITAISGFVIKLSIPLLQKRLQKRLNVCDDIEILKQKIEEIGIRIEGQMAFADSIKDHEVRLRVLEKIVDRRTETKYVEVDRRKSV